MSFCLRLLFCLLQFTPSLSYPIFFPHYFTRGSCSYSLPFSHFPSTSSQINISMSLLSLSSPDESSLHYEIEFIIKQKWIDPRLVHDDGNRWKIKSSFHGFLLRYPTLNALHHHGDIWKPDIYFIKHGTFKVNRLNHPSRMDFMQTHLST